MARDLERLGVYVGHSRLQPFLPAHRHDGVVPPDAIASCITLLPGTLAPGYIMIRTGDFVAPAIVHTFADWFGTLGP